MTIKQFDKAIFDLFQSFFDDSYQSATKKTLGLKTIETPANLEEQVALPAKKSVKIF